MSIKVNISGIIFETTVDTLKKINYFKYILEDTNYDNTQVLFVDRPAHIFKHVLALAGDQNYSYPLKYKNELDFYDVPYDLSKLYRPKCEHTNKIKKLEKTVNEQKNKIIKLEEMLNDNKNKKCTIPSCRKSINTWKTYCRIHKNRCQYIADNHYYDCHEYCDNSKGEIFCNKHYNTCRELQWGKYYVCIKQNDIANGIIYCKKHAKRHQ